MNNSVKLTPKDRMEIARFRDRPCFDDYVRDLFTDYFEMHGDRYYGEDSAISGGIARFIGRPVTVIGNVKGKNTNDNISRNFGMAHPEGYRKSLRLMRQAEKFDRPIICLVDTAGAFCGVGAEERGQGEAIAVNLKEMMSLEVPVVSVITGQGGSGGALALAVANEVFMLENAIYSVISPRGFASILWKDPSREKEAADIMRITAQELFDFGIIEKIIEEPQGGAHNDVAMTVNGIREALKETLDRLSCMDRKELRDQRYKKYRCIGVFGE